jgi:hypothetical protein
LAGDVDDATGDDEVREGKLTLRTGSSPTGSQANRLIG